MLNRRLKNIYTHDPHVVHVGGFACCLLSRCSFFLVLGVAILCWVLVLVGYHERRPLPAYKLSAPSLVVWCSVAALAVMWFVVQALRTGR